MLQGFPSNHGGRRHRPLATELSVEALRWIETYLPILGVAAFLGVSTAGGFDLLLKLIAVALEVLATVGVVVLPQMLRARNQALGALARAVRTSTVIATPSALLYAFTAVPALEQLTKTRIDAGASAVVLAIVILLAPWEAVSRAALLTVGRPWWLLPTQIVISVAALAGVALTPLGMLWAAAASAAGHVVASLLYATGLAHAAILPPASALFSATSMVEDFRASWRALAPGQRSN
jgi:hypothetical protein